MPGRYGRGMTHPQVWFITGAARGIGRALALAALDAGHAVFATVRGEHGLPEHERLAVHPLDVRDRDTAHAAIGAAVERFGRVDVLVNNAGYGLVGAVEELSEAEVRQIIDTDLLGALWLSQAVVAPMRERGSGRILQISTTGAIGSMPTLGLYNAAKWGLEGFSEALAAEVRGFGIGVTIVEPGGVDTEWGTGSMRFATPLPEYDGLRTALFGTADVPWPNDGGTGGGTAPEAIAAALLAHVADPASAPGEDGAPLRLLLGDDAPVQAAAALRLRVSDYGRDDRFAAAWAEED